MKRPCIRGLKQFKNGCPEKPWDGKSGCPAWVEILFTPKNDPLKPKDKIGNCVDIMNFELNHTALGLLEGNQQAIESFRNNMSTKEGPKPNIAELQLLRELKEGKEQRQAVINYEVTKRLSEC